MPRYCDYCTPEGFVTKNCWLSNPDELSYAVVKNGAVQKTYTGPHAFPSALAHAKELATSHRRYPSLKELPACVRIETYSYSKTDGFAGEFVHIGHDRLVTEDGTMVEDRTDYTPRGLVLKSVRRRMIHRATVPHARCSDVQGCIEPVLKKEKCR